MRHKRLDGSSSSGIQTCSEGSTSCQEIAHRDGVWTMSKAQRQVSPHSKPHFFRFMYWLQRLRKAIYQSGQILSGKEDMVLGKTSIQRSLHSRTRSKPVSRIH